MSATGGGEAAIGRSADVAVDATGRFIAFESVATNRVDGDANGASDVKARFAT